MTFGDAMNCIRRGQRMRRLAWVSGRFVMLFRAEPSHLVRACVAEHFPCIEQDPGGWQPGWVPSQEDMLSDDWIAAHERPPDPSDERETLRPPGG